MAQHFPFAFERRYRIAGAPFGVTPSRTGVRIEDGTFLARFGLWQVRTALDNITGTQVTGGFAFVKTAGPAHLSFTDRGLTFATTSERALCLTFAEPVRGIDPFGRIRHPGLTVTVEDVDGLAAAIATGA